MKTILTLVLFLLSAISYSQKDFEYAPHQLIVKVNNELFNRCKKYVETKKKDDLLYINNEFKDIGIYRIDKLHIMNKFLPEDAERSFVIYFNNKSNINLIIDKLKTVKTIESVSPNYIGKTLIIEPNDDKYDKQWSLQKIKMPEAWVIQKGCKSIKVAVLDIGFRKNEHNDIKNKYTDTRRDETDIDINAYESVGYKKISGEDYDTPDNLPYSKGYHGQQVSGVVGAETNNNKGLASVGWNIDILPVRCGFYIKNQSGFKVGLFEEDDIIRAIDWVVANGEARIINLSFGGNIVSSFYDESVNACNDAGIVLVASAGNGEYGNEVEFPASHPLIIAVGATNQYDTKATFSCYGNNLDLVAPGYKVWIINKKTGFSRYIPESGTSISAPLVSAAAALILSQNPELTPEQVRLILRESADKVAGMNGQNFHEYYGYGRLNVFRALQFVPAVKYNYVLENEIIKDYRNIQAVQTIAAGNNYIIKTSAEVIFKAGEEIILNPGFETEEGADFTAYIGNVDVNECIPDCPNISVETYPNIISSNLCYTVENANSFEISVNNNIGQLVFFDAGNFTDNSVCVWDASSFANGNYQVTIIFRNECGKVSEKNYTVTKVSGKKSISLNNITNSNTFYFDVYPNPANEKAEIYLTVSQKVSLCIFIKDLTGRKIKKIADLTNVKKGVYKIPVNLSKIKQGIYFITVKSKENIQTKKIIHTF